MHVYVTLLGRVVTIFASIFLEGMVKWKPSKLVFPAYVTAHEVMVGRTLVAYLMKCYEAAHSEVFYTYRFWNTNRPPLSIDRHSTSLVPSAWCSISDPTLRGAYLIILLSYYLIILLSYYLKFSIPFCWMVTRYSWYIKIHGWYKVHYPCKRVSEYWVLLK